MHLRLGKGRLLLELAHYVLGHRPGVPDTDGDVALTGDGITHSEDILLGSVDAQVPVVELVEGACHLESFDRLRDAAYRGNKQRVPDLQLGPFQRESLPAIDTGTLHYQAHEPVVLDNHLLGQVPLLEDEAELRLGHVENLRPGGFNLRLRFL